MDFLRHLFSHICGQVNCWHAGGVVSAACQRCTGLYIGALVAAIAFVTFRPRPTSRSLWLHGIAMLLMLPFGYHLVPQSTVVRAITGQLFGYGMSFYLLLLPADRFDFWCTGIPTISSVWYLISLITAIPVILLGATSGSPLAVTALSYLAFAGLMSVTYLISWNALILLATAWGAVSTRMSGTA
ncbi:MAG: DUF2085 domain-containing protein [Terriglobia bacterium]|jgi:uncharacterized membrane protein|nr:DUF2085 domain-containing protein [Terriglobia bacterium]